MQEALEMTKEEMDFAAHQLIQAEVTQTSSPPLQQSVQYPKPPPRQNRSGRL